MTIDRLEIGMQFDDVRAIAASSRWEVIAIDREKMLVTIKEIAIRIGPPPKAYLQARRKMGVPDRFAGWELWQIDDGGTIKTISIETLLRTADYVPVLKSTSTQEGLFDA